jgi:isocitrate/isopropylmalate dehydrogenase
MSVAGRTYRIGVAEGDGIGPEITAATLAVLDAASERHPSSARSRRIVGVLRYETQCLSQILRSEAEIL